MTGRRRCIRKSNPNHKSIPPVNSNKKHNKIKYAPDHFNNRKLKKRCTNNRAYNSFNNTSMIDEKFRSSMRNSDHRD
ncbi:hypothetical protein L484_013399 [Morus notabilis]|uniref:Uncharacterized protein n=1 Tax=Morus notabilis TaxID=981085 RepID=W9QZ07_9ROSA|nr:hypothetical protein L484_013399 [Morus notabilis]